jgi:hypothetical protein
MKTELILYGVKQHTAALKKNLKVLSIILTQRADDWHACIEGEPEVWDRGRNRFEAIGALIVTHSERFAILPK